MLMKSKQNSSFRGWLKRSFAMAIIAGAVAIAAPAQANDTIKIGFSMALTGGLAGAGKGALIAMQVWAEDVNAKGGLLGKQVELIYYDDQTNPATVPAIYTKLLDIDEVDFVVSGYGTNLIAPAMPIVMQRGLVFPSLFGLAVNEKFNYPNYFPDHAVGAGAHDGLVAGLLRSRHGAGPAAEDDRARGRRCRVRQECGEWRADQCGEPGARDRLRRVPIRRGRRTTRRSSTRFRRAILTSSTSARTRRIRSGW